MRCWRCFVENDKRYGFRHRAPVVDAHGGRTQQLQENGWEDCEDWQDDSNCI